MLARLVSSVEIAAGVRHFLFEAEAVDALQFSAGQFVSFSRDVGGKEITRAYSLASAPAGSNRFELCLNRVDDGHLSPVLFDMAPGDTIVMREPLGMFTLRNAAREALFIATGTGIAPFRSMLLAHLHPGSPPFTLLFGVRYEAGLLYRAEFEEMTRRYPHFRFQPTLTRPEASWSGFTGRVQTHLPASHSPSLDVYLCGLKEMVDDVRTILKQMGFDRKQIFYEKYD